MEVKVFESSEAAKNILENKTPRLVKVGNTNICLIRLNEKLIAFRNECPHMGESLHKGVINYLGQIVCPLHTYKFSLESGNEDANRCGSLHFIEVLEKKDGIYLSSSLF